ncbi:MAG: indole-3-glycerol-phosphate synthase [Planctomycetes bacterium]|nr:indole-3-glycerol-phosphate synthase [Planctomycetota bacterium]
MSGFLDLAFAEAHHRVERWRREDLLAVLRSKPAPRRPPGAFSAAIRSARRPALIAEIKRASPSRGPLCPGVGVAERARLYADAGAAAVSVLTESQWFAGSIDDLATARSATHRPLLRKDFIVNEYDLEVSAALGADAVLLIAAGFDVARLHQLVGFAGSLGIETLVEAHGTRGAEAACEAGAAIVGVNSRDLNTLEVDFDGALRAVRFIPEDRLCVLESGIRAPDDVRAALEAGADAVLVGEALMRCADPAALIGRLLAGAAGWHEGETGAARR